MKIRTASLFASLLLVVLLGCKQTEAPSPATTPTSMVGNWRISALTLNPRWPKIVNGSPEYFTDYVQFLQRINETCFTDVVWTFGATGSLSTNLNSINCDNKGGNSRLILSEFVPAGATYAETANTLNLKGAANLTNWELTRTFGPNTARLEWKDDTDVSGEAIPTSYTLVLTKQ